MKKGYILFLNLLIVTRLCYSQDLVLTSEKYPELRFSPLKGEVFYSAYRQIKGNPYLTEDWSIGTIHLENGEAIRNVQFRFDIYGHRVLVYQDYLKRVVIPDKSEIESFSYKENGKIRNFKSVNAELTSQKMLAQYFIEVMNEGRVSFYKLYYYSVLPLKTPEMPYIDEFLLQQDYYLFYNGRYEVAKLRKSFLCKSFPEYKPEIKHFIREKKLKMKKEGDFALVIGHLGDLMTSNDK